MIDIINKELIVVHYRDALRQHRQEAIATAALEALTQDSILHRRDVKTLVIEHKEKTETKNEIGWNAQANII